MAEREPLIEARCTCPKRVADGSRIADLASRDCPTHGVLACCDCCGTPFPEPVTNWDDFFSEIEDASFYCESCAIDHGLPLADEE